MTIIGCLTGLRDEYKCSFRSVRLGVFISIVQYTFGFILKQMSLLSKKSEETFSPRLPLLQMPVANLEVPKAALSSDQLATNAGVSQTSFKV